MKIEREIIEWRKCVRSPAYFVDTYCQIYDSETNQWVPFHLWKEQYEVLMKVHNNQFTIVLKSRQIGLSWLLLAYALWLMIFVPISVILIFSKRDDEAVYLAGVERLRGMYERLPDWMKAEAVEVDNDHVWLLSNGSNARAFSTKGGDGYTASLAIIDEADLVPDLRGMLRGIKATIDAGGKLALISRVDKDKPNSLFKKIFRAALKGLNNYVYAFLPWWVRPGRTQEWYEAECRAILADEGSLDTVWEQYPSTIEEALAPPTLNKRIPAKWLESCYVESTAVDHEQLPADLWSIEGLDVFRLPEAGRKYVAGADCAEGLETSDDSVTIWLDALTGEQMAVLCGKLSPAMHAAYSVLVSSFYNQSPILPENNNHGWSFIQWVSDHSRIAVLEGHDGKVGWSTSSLSKVIMYQEAAETFRLQDATLHDLETYLQLSSIEKSTLRAPEGEMDDRATAWCCANMARSAATEQVVYDDDMRVNIGWQN